MLTLETCLKLKAAGFDCSGSDLVYVSHNGEVKCTDYRDPVLTGNETKFLCACPTLEELLEAIRDMGRNVRLMYEDKAPGWYISNEWCFHTDPSEAAAALWLKLKDTSPSR